MDTLECDTAHTTVAAASVARWVAQQYGLAVQQCHLIRRGLNDNYALRLSDGTRCVARLYSIRPRGRFNVDFEVALLEHLVARGVGVAAPLRTLGGGSHTTLPFAEGVRALAVFRHADGAVPSALEEFALTGRTLAQLHQAAADYAGPASHYTLDGHHLAGRTRAYLDRHPDLDASLIESYHVLIDTLLRQLADVEPQLTRVLCHGDTHGYNNHVHQDAEGNLSSVFFDFDDAGPGFLVYDLCVLPWSHLCRLTLTEVDDSLRERWAHYFGGYRAGGGRVSEADLAALPLFIQLRHLWNMGEAVSRLHHWGTANASADWLRKQRSVFDAWAKVELGA